MGTQPDTSNPSLTNTAEGTQQQPIGSVTGWHTQNKPRTTSQPQTCDSSLSPRIRPYSAHCLRDSVTNANAMTAAPVCAAISLKESLLSPPLPLSKISHRRQIVVIVWSCGSQPPWHTLSESSSEKKKKKTIAFAVGPEVGRKRVVYS